MVRKIKLDGTTSEHEMILVQRDDTGWWLYSPAGTVVTRSDKPPYTQPGDGVQFFPAGRWFAAWSFAAAADPPSEYWTRPWIAIDIAEPARLDLGAGLVSFVDLELDLWCSDDGAEVVDQEDLAEAERQGLITRETAERARRTAEDLATELSVGHRAAFGGIGWRLLDQARSPIPGGPGYQIHPLTLRPMITDLQAFRAGLIDDPCRAALEALWSERPADAATQLDQLLIIEPRSIRLRALRADCDRDLGRFDAAIDTYQRLLKETANTVREATIVQHLGKAQFAAGRYADAAKSFDRAATLRRNAAADLLESAVRSRDRARQLAAS